PSTGFLRRASASATTSSSWTTSAGFAAESCARAPTWWTLAGSGRKTCRNITSPKWPPAWCGKHFDCSGVGLSSKFEHPAVLSLGAAARPLGQLGLSELKGTASIHRLEPPMGMFLDSLFEVRVCGNDNRV